MKIVVRTPNWIGDMIFALPALRSVAAHFPGADIRLAGPDWIGALLAGSEFAGRAVRAEVGTLRAASFDAGLILANSFSSALLLRRARVPERWGYRADGRGWLLTKAVRRRKARPPVHMVRYYLGLLEGLDIPARRPSIAIAPSAEGQERADRRLAGLGFDPARPLVLLAPGAAHGPAKRWPAARFAETGRLLRERRGAAVAVVGSAADAPLASEIAAAPGERPADLTGKTGLAELLGLLRRAAILVSNDSGPLHAANALGTPVVAVFGPTDPRATGPFDPPARVVRREGIPCWPCRFRLCPYDHRCMTGITAGEAAAAAEELMG